MFYFIFNIATLNSSIAQFNENDTKADNTGGPPGLPGPGDEPESAPIDGGITLLIAAGIGYGVKKHRENRKKKTVQFE